MTPQGPMPFERRTLHPVILCVDDEPQVLSALRRSLSTEPYEVLTAQGAEEALCWFEELPIDLVLTDQLMPGTKGTELLREVRKRSPRTARAILTAHLGMTKEGLEAGAATVLYKPWNDEVLRRTVRRVLATSSR
jgi:DNA-binding response OmpR family regulator